MNLMTPLDFTNMNFDDHFELYLQFQFDMRTNKPNSAEALIRAQGLNIANVAPTKILDQVERLGISSLITRWVLNKTLEAFPEIHQTYGINRIAVNVSPSELIGDTLFRNVNDALKHHNLDGSCLEIEITEKLPIPNIAHVSKQLNKLRALGVRVVLDDFGAGHTSLASLVQLPLDGIKLDKLFCRNIQNQSHIVMAEILIELAKKLDFSVMIEGIEDQTLQERFIAMGCTIGQGYHFHKPSPCFELINSPIFTTLQLAV